MGERKMRELTLIELGLVSRSGNAAECKTDIYAGAGIGAVVGAMAGPLGAGVGVLVGGAIAAANIVSSK